MLSEASCLFWRIRPRFQADISKCAKLAKCSADTAIRASADLEFIIFEPCLHNTSFNALAVGLRVLPGMKVIHIS